MPKVKNYDVFLDRLSALMIRADNESQRLNFCEFKQFFDEEFSPKVWDLLE